MLKQSVAVLFMAGVVACAGGCLVMSGKSIDESGVRVTSATLNQIQLGQTTEAWLVATLGDPTDRTEVEGQEGVAVLRYEHVECRSEGGAVFLLFAGGSDIEKRTTAYFEVVDGVITRYWMERGTN